MPAGSTAGQLFSLALLPLFEGLAGSPTRPKRCCKAVEAHPSACPAAQAIGVDATSTSGVPAAWRAVLVRWCTSAILGIKSSLPHHLKAGYGAVVSHTRAQRLMLQAPLPAWPMPACADTACKPACQHAACILHAAFCSPQVVCGPVPESSCNATLDRLLFYRHSKRRGEHALWFATEGEEGSEGMREAWAQSG